MRVDFLQIGVKLVFQAKLLFLEGFNFILGTQADPGLHILNLLIQLVVLVKQSIKMVISVFQLGYQFTIFWKQSVLLNQGLRSMIAFALRLLAG